MQLEQARVLVCGASGVLGGLIARALTDAGATVVAAGRDSERVAAVARDCGTEPLVFDVVDDRSCGEVVTRATDLLDGLDVLVVATGVAAFGPAVSADPSVVEELFAVNVLGPMNLVRAAAPRLTEGGAVVVLSAILADLPTNDMAEYSASKAALATWLTVLRRENRRRFGVIDVRPPHVDTGLAGRALAGDPPRLPAGYPAGRVVDRVLSALRDDAREVVFDAATKDLQVH